MGIVYKLDFANGKSYIGITTRGLEQRMREHIIAAEKNKKFIVYRAWRKHGKPDIKIIARLPDDKLEAAEIRFIEKLNTLAPSGYNMTHGGDTSPSLIPEICARIGKANSIALKGRKLPEELKFRLSKVHKDRYKKNGHHLTGSTWSPARRAAHKITLARGIKPWTDERRANFAKACTGRVMTKETRDKISQSKTGKRKGIPWSDARRAAYESAFDN